MRRWTQTCEAHGRTIAVDVPIIVTEAERMPVLTVESVKLYEDEEFEAFHLAQMRMEEEQGQDRKIFEYHIEPDETNEWKSGARIVSKSRALGSVSKETLINPLILVAINGICSQNEIIIST